MRAKRLVIAGRVQGVGYREWMVREAQRLGVSGWVRNRPDGSVEALVYGGVDAVEELLRSCRRGPRMAAVSRIEEDWADPPDAPGFVRRDGVAIVDPVELRASGPHEVRRQARLFQRGRTGLVRLGHGYQR
jgi:acylphosphatase